MGNDRKSINTISQYASFFENIKDIAGMLFHQSYQVFPAVTDDMKQAAYQVRHKVYCSELHYEDANQFGMERDNYDDHSTQLVVYSKAADGYVGCSRIVHAHYNGEYKTLPFEHHCHGKLDYKIINMVKNSGYKYAEVSRLSIDKDFRHIGRDEVAKAMGMRRKSSLILLNLYLGTNAMAKAQGIQYLFAIVEPRLLNNMQRVGIPAIQIGNGIEHRGLRVPIMIDVDGFCQAMPTLIRPLYNAIYKNVSIILETHSDSNLNIPSIIIDKENKKFATL